MLAAAEHCGGDAGHDRLGLHVQVAIHLVRLPTSNEADPIAVDARAEEGHRPSGACGPCRDVGDGESEVRVKSDRRANVACHVGRKQVGPNAIGENGIDRGSGARLVLAKVGDPGDQAEDWTQRWVAGPGMANGFAPDSVLLGRKRERGEGSGQQLGKGAEEDVEFARANPQADILEAKQVVGLMAWYTSEFARPKQKI